MREACGTEANHVYRCWRRQTELSSEGAAGVWARQQHHQEFHRWIITFTPKGLSSLEEAVKTFGHEVKHLKDFAAGVMTSSEALAEEAGEKLWMVVDAMRNP